MILLTDETMSNMVTDYHFSGVQNRNVLCKKVAKAQLKKVEKWLKQHTDRRYWGEGHCTFSQSLLDEVK